MILNRRLVTGFLSLNQHIARVCCTLLRGLGEGHSSASEVSKLEHLKVGTNPRIHILMTVFLLLFGWWCCVCCRRCNQHTSFIFVSVPVRSSGKCTFTASVTKGACELLHFLGINIALHTHVACVSHHTHTHIRQ